MPFKSIEEQRASNRKSYKKHAEKVKAAVIARKKEIGAWWKQYKATLVCFHCGEDDPDSIDLHHVITDRRTSKTDSSASWAHDGRSKERIMRDVQETCVPLCSNCHRKVHTMHRRLLREQALKAGADILDKHETL
jgi:5-methylcytosine-specific restriction endonuclease McrA